MTSTELHWEHEISYTGKTKRRTQTEFFSLLMLATKDESDVWVFVDSHRSIARSLQHKYEVSFSGPNAMKMAERFVTSLTRMEDLMLDYIRMVQEDSVEWIAHAENYENNQQGDALGQPRP